VQALTAGHSRVNTSTCWFGAMFMALPGGKAAKPPLQQVNAAT